MQKIVAIIAALLVTLAAPQPQTQAAEITINLGSATIPDNAVIQTRMKAWLDQKADPAGAGSNYAARFRAWMRKTALDALKSELRQFEEHEAWKTAEANLDPVDGVIDSE